MKITNFKKTGPRTATVDVTTGILWFKKTRTEKISLGHGEYWFFVETGEFTPGHDVEKLCRSYNAKLNEP